MYVKIALISLIVVWMLAVRQDDANADPMLTTFTGTTDSADTGNQFLLETGIAILGIVQWVSEDITGSGSEEINYGVDNNSACMMSIEFGDITLCNENDVDYHTGLGPALKFQDGDVVGVDWFTFMGVNGADVFTLVGSFSEDWVGEDSEGKSVSGHWDSVTSGLAPVPEPSLELLLGISLVGLVGVGAVRKIKKKKAVNI